jgi:hypothetical protein
MGEEHGNVSGSDRNVGKGSRSNWAAHRERIPFSAAELGPEKLPIESNNVGVGGSAPPNSEGAETSRPLRR